MLVNDEISFDYKNVQFVNVIETMTMFEKSTKMTMSIVSMMMMMKTMNEFDDDDEALLMMKTNETNCISIGDNNANENNRDDWNSIDDDRDDDDELSNMMTKDDVENLICVRKAMGIDDLWKSWMIRLVFDEIFSLLMLIDVVLVIKFLVFQFFLNCPNFVVTNWNFVFCRR